MKPLPYILLLALCGCVSAPKQKAEIGKAEMATINPMNFDGKLIDAPPSPITANVGSQMLRASPNISAPSTQAVVLSETITASWRNNNTGNPDVITSLQSTTDLTSGNWVTLWETNCDDEITVATIPRPQVPTTFYRNGNRLIE